jgi:hypothetical protein
MVTITPMTQIPRPLIGGTYLHCPACPKDKRRRVRTLTQYRRHYIRRHLRTNLVYGPAKVYTGPLGGQAWTRLDTPPLTVSTAPGQLTWDSPDADIAGDMHRAAARAEQQYREGLTRG